jgi:prepilin-type processing-associated H-X9-DG protein
MAIIAVLIALTIPAVMRARESANQTQCKNNLHQFGLAFQAHHDKYGYYPTAGTGDFAGPSFSAVGSMQAVAGFQQDAGWGFQLLPHLDAEATWGGGSASTTVGQMKAAIAPAMKVFYCPSRRPSSTGSYTNVGFPSQAAYKTVLGKTFTVAYSDYAACNGNSAPVGSPGVPVNNGVVRSQWNGTAFVRATVKSTDITDGAGFTLLVGEKAGSGKIGGTILNEDDMGYFAGFSSANFNTIRFTSPTLLPLPDYQVTGPTGGAFGSAHSGSFNVLMADGNVRSLAYTIDSGVYAAIGTIAGREIVSETDLDF